MKKQKLALLLVFAMLWQPGASVKAQEKSAYQGETEAYVVMGENLEVIEEIIGTEIGESSFEAGNEEIVMLELTKQEVKELERSDVLIEEDTLFRASTVNQVLDVSEQEETEITEETIGEADETEAGTEQREEVDEAAKTSETEEESKITELTETEENETTKTPEEVEGEEVELIEETEITEFPEEMDETEQTAECSIVPEKEEAEAREDWNLAAIHAEGYVKAEAAGERVKIAVLDSGINYRSNVPVKAHVSMLEGKEDESNSFLEDATGHGTAIASLMVSSLDEESIQGINEDAEVYSVQILDENNTGTLSGVVQGIYWAIENDMDIINMSFGTQYSSEILQKAVEDAADAGILLVAAAGNGAEKQVEYPAAYEEVIAVGASNLQGGIASDSTRGSEVDIYAPGSGVQVNAPFFGTSLESGSSLACAQVSAAASVLWECDKSKSAAFIRALLEETANDGIDLEYGKGLLDVEEAMNCYADFVPGERNDCEEEKPLLEFDEGEISALWIQADHQKMIPEGISGYRLMNKAAVYPDTGDNKTNILHRNRMFHGSKNYEAALEFLVNLAHEYYLKDSGNPNAVYEKAKGDSRLKYKDKKSGKEINTVSDIKWYLNNTIFPELGIDETTRHNKAYKLMGVVIHVVGDIYAHRTLVTAEMLNRARNTGNRNEGYFVKSDFDDWKGFVNLVKEGKAEFRNIATYTKKLNKDDKRGDSKWYEDNVAVESWRYQDASAVVKTLVKDGGKYDFRTKSWNAKALLDREKLS